jgi:hypothetical protein
MEKRYQVFISSTYADLKEERSKIEKVDPKETVSFEELLMSNVYTQEALVNLLEAKGIIKKAELIEEIRKLRERYNRLKS